MLHQCIHSSAIEWRVPTSAIEKQIAGGKGGLGVMHLTPKDIQLALQGGFKEKNLSHTCGNIQAGTWLIAIKADAQSQQENIRACFTQSAEQFHVQPAEIMNRLRYSAYHPNQSGLGVMHIQVGWEPILRAAGFSISDIKTDPCYGIEAGTFVLAFQSEWLQHTQNGYTLRIAPHEGLNPPAFLVPIIHKYCDEYSVPYDLVVAIINRESAFDPNAISVSGAIGYMQLMPDTAASMGVNPWIPDQNIKGGVRYLSDLLRKFNGNKVLAVAGYNAGGHAVVQWGYRIPPYTQTIAYVPAVLSVYKYLKEKS